MIKKKVSLGAPSDKKKNPYLKNNGGIDLIEKFPNYKKKKKRKIKKVRGVDLKWQNQKNT